MTDSWYDVVERGLLNGVLIDSNLLLVFIVGMGDPALISQFDRTSAYDREAFELFGGIPR